MPRVLRGSQGGGHLLMGEVPLSSPNGDRGATSFGVRTKSYQVYRDTSLTRPPPLPRSLGGSQEGRRFLMGGVLL